MLGLLELDLDKVLAGPSAVLIEEETAATDAEGELELLQTLTLEEARQADLIHLRRERQDLADCLELSCLEAECTAMRSELAAVEQSAGGAP